VSEKRVYMTNPRRILVTGGAGFIGTHLVNRLLKRYPNVKLEIIDDLSSSSLTDKRYKFFEENNIKFKEMTVEKWREDIHKYDQIYHLACKVGPAHVLKYTGRIAGEIIRDAIKMADLAIRDDAPLVSISTSEVYGRDPKGIPQSEKLALEVPSKYSARVEYSVGKLMTEISLINLSQVTKLKVNFIRPFNIVGPYQTGEGGFVLPRFVASALRGETITVFGNGSQTRSFTHVSDLVESLLLIMESDVKRKIYNIGTPFNTISIMDLAKKVISLTKSKSEIVLVDPKKIFGPLYSDAPSKIPDISFIINDLGWNPFWSLDQIILDYVNFLEN
jgi:UDP-glucose 4-epimerase